jgi:MFS-type transporter involved in bile tolerance (Atg22 family)
MALADAVDRVMARVLFVTPPPPADEEVMPEEAKEGRTIGLALVISGVRCTLQYLILPVVLPLIGLASGFSLIIAMALDLVALWLLISGLRYFWRTRHPHRFDMLPLSAAILAVIVGSFVYDVWRLIS